MAQRKDEQTIMAVLNILVSNNLNYMKTARECNVERTTIFRWAKKHGIDRNIKKEVRFVKEKEKEITPFVTFKQHEKSLDARRKQFELSAFSAKEKMLEQLIVSIKETKDIEKIARSMKLLEDITGETITVSGTTNNTANFIQVVTDQLKLMNHEPTDH